MVGIELHELRQIPWVVGVAVGIEKARAILGAQRGGYINVLVTDETTARAILRLDRGGTRRLNLNNARSGSVSSPRVG